MKKINYKLDYYNILNVDFDFTLKEVKKSYRNLSKKYHPDKIKTEDNIFEILSEAYTVLTNDKLREKYDSNSKYGKNYDSFNELMNFDFNNSNVSTAIYDKRKDNFKKKELLHIVLEFSDYPDIIEYSRNVICSKCDGSGTLSVGSLNLQGKLGSLFDDEEIKCDICDGTGLYQGRECPICKGNGYTKLGLSECDNCNGSGIKEVVKKLKIDKSKFKDGKLMIKYHGNQSKYNNSVGNLYLIVKN